MATLGDTDPETQTTTEASSVNPNMKQLGLDENLYSEASSVNPNMKQLGLDKNLYSDQAPSSTNKFENSELSENGVDTEINFRITFRRIGAGLQNLGNTCYLNSVLQCLTYTEPLAAYLQSGKHNFFCRTAGFCALCAIQKHVGRALQSNGRILQPKYLVSNLRFISQNFRYSRQEDAHEYMVSLLESMHKCCLPSGVPSESPSAYDKSLVHKIFGGRLRSQVKCMECSNCSNKFEPFLDLSLEIEKADSVYMALTHFTAKEQLDGGAKQYQCQQCNQKVEALKQLTVFKAPHVLAIHLKRFCPYLQEQKNNKSITFGLKLDLKPFVTGPYDGDLSYTLYGVLVHAGWSIHSGHYYCFIRTSSGIWYSLDDNEVVQVSEEEVLEQKAYMLFYVRDRSDFSAKKPADVGQGEHLNVTDNSTISKFNPEIREKILVSLTEKKLDTNFSAASPEIHVPTVIDPKETSLKNIPVQDLNSTLILDCSNLNPEPPMVMNTSEVSPEIQEKKTNGFIQKNFDTDVPAVIAPNDTPLENIPFQNVGSTVNRDCLTLKRDRESEPSSVVPKSDPLATTKCLSCGIAKSKRSQRRLRMNFFKYQVTGMQLSSNIIFCVAFSKRKKKRKQRKYHYLQQNNPNLKILPRKKLQLNLLFAPSKALPSPIDHHAKSERKLVNCDLDMKLSDEFRERAGPRGNMLSSEKQACEMRQTSIMNHLTRGLEETTPKFARFHEIDVSLSQKRRPRQEVDAQIGYFGDEWDEEYDRGKRKKKRLDIKINYGGHNSFQVIAPRKNAKREVEKKLIRSGSENLPFRI